MPHDPTSVPPLSSAMTQAQENQPNGPQVAAVVSFYMVAALVVCCNFTLGVRALSIPQMVFVNKAVLNTTPDLPTLLLVRDYGPQVPAIADHKTTP